MPLQLTLRKVMRSRVPWWAKGALKLSLAKVPIPYSTLRSLSLAQHGGMERPEWALGIFQQHYDAVKFHRKRDGFTLLELGPGDSLFTAPIAFAHGASASWHIDVGSFANPAPQRYRQMASFLSEKGLKAPDLSGAGSLADVLQTCNASYLTNGLDSLRTLPDAGVDFIFSNSVLQHVRKENLPATLAELRRVIHPQGASVHAIDLRDMMGQSLHHLRFSERVWESQWFRQAEFYTNRLRLTELVAEIAKAGFSVEVIENNCWAALPVPRAKLSMPYRDMAENDLLPATVRIALRPQAGG